MYFNKVYIEITNVCNLNCSFCSKTGRTSSFMSLSEFEYIAREVKEFKANPDNFKGHVGDISTVIRVRITGRCNTPDLYEILKVLGKERIMKRV